MTLRPLALVAVAAILTGGLRPPLAVAQTYVKKPTRAETVVATLAAFDLPTLAGKWYYVGPFDNVDGAGFDTAYPPEKGIDLTATYAGKRGQKIGWKELPRFKLGTVYDFMPLFPRDRTDACVYLFTEIETKQAVVLPLSLGSDDTLSVFLGRNRLLHANHNRAAAPDQDRVALRMSAGKHQLLVKICQGSGEWQGYVCPELPDTLPAEVRKKLAADFPVSASLAGSIAPTNEDQFYHLTTLPQPADCVLEVGGLGLQADGSLLACTRRGEVWRVTNPAGDPSAMRFTRFAAGLHEALGLHVEADGSVLVVQRPEMTRLTDTNGDGVADRFETVCDKWGVSGDYHEFAFGPAVDKEGKAFVTLNVGFGGGHQAKSPWRGWCLKIDPKTGDMEPWAYGLRSPNGINFAPNGDLFYADNQGEWVATNKLNHIRKGQFYGHQAPLQWVKKSPFAAARDKVASGMWYDGQNGGFPAVDPPSVWFPYGRMGQSITEPRWDTTGKFGPFAGQCFVGDQTRSVVMRVAMEQVNGVYQGACFPFRNGFQSGVNRLLFAPDGSLYAGETARGWGSVGGKPYGLQRLNYTGVLPFEVHTMTVTKTGFDLTFTKPVEAGLSPANFPMKSFTYVYHSSYGCPETDTRPEPVTAVTLSADRLRASITVPGRAKGRVYDLRLTGVKAATGEDVLHPEAYYTLNEIP